MTELELVSRILATCDKYDHRDLFWRTGKRFEPEPGEPTHYAVPASFFVNCNDLFWWGCADGEEITAENIDEFENAHADCKAADPVIGAIYAQGLFAARVRKMRPQGAAYSDQEWLWPLYDACGPERDVDHGNPKPRPTTAKVA